MAVLLYHRIGAWFRDTLLPFLKKHWKAVAVVAGTIIAVLVGKELEGLLFQSRVGRVKSPLRFWVADKNHLRVATPDGRILVELPAGVKAKDVSAVQFTPGKPAVVEVRNATLDDA